MLLTRRSFALGGIGSTIAAVTGALAADLAPPQGPVILEVSGNIARHNGNGVARFDRDTLEALGRYEIVTETPWTEGSVRFEGVLVRDVMSLVGAQGTVVRAAALNDYTIEIPMSDFDMYDVILAIQRDGEYLTIRDRGPLWVVYPWSSDRNLQNELYYSRSIWQLKALSVR